MERASPDDHSPEHGREPASVPLAGPWIAMLILALSLLAWLGFQTFHLVRERQALVATHAGQDTAIQQAQRVRAQLDGIARRTLELAQQGHAGAASIVEQLARRGVRINAGAGSAPASQPEVPSR